MTINQPNSKYNHVYAVIRIDMFMFAGLNHPPTADEISRYLSVVKVVHSETDAGNEVVRLSKLTADKDVFYYSTISRMPKTT